MVTELVITIWFVKKASFSSSFFTGKACRTYPLSKLLTWFSEILLQRWNCTHGHSHLLRSSYVVPCIGHTLYLLRQVYSNTGLLCGHIACDCLSQCHCSYNLKKRCEILLELLDCSSWRMNTPSANNNLWINCQLMYPSRRYNYRK